MGIINKKERKDRHPYIQELEELFRKGRITRREFLARLSALGITAALSPALLSTSVQASTPKKGGRLRFGSASGSTSDSLDPATMSAMTIINMNYLLRNNLIEIDHKFNAIPELAESWEASPGALKWVFKLRKGVEFHNGKTLEANDVIYSINHHRGEKSKSGAKVLAEAIQDIKADGKDTVIFTLKSGSADFQYILSDYHLTISPEGTTDWNKGIGTGGYTLVSFEPGVRCLAKRNPNYWKEGRAHFDEVEVIGINDPNARTTALMTGKVDAIDRVERRTAPLLKKTAGIELLNTKGLEYYEFPMLVDVPPFNNIDVRLALKHAIDREEMVDKILRGFGAVGNDHPISSIMKYHAAGLPQRKYDPDKARFHLKKAGMEGTTFKLHVAEQAFQGAVDAAVLYKEHAAKAGIKIEVVQESSDGYWDNVWLKKPWCAGAWGGRPTVDMMFSVAFAADAAWNTAHWKNKRFNELLLKARAELDEKKRAEMYYEMQELVRDDGGVVIPMFGNFVEAATTKLQHGPISGNLEMDNARAAERWWFES